MTAVFIATSRAAAKLMETAGSAIQRHIDAAAGARGYADGVSCCSYQDSGNPAWAAEAQVFKAWRDAVWVYAFTELAKVQAGQRQQPTIAELIAELPAIRWPG